MANCTKLQGGRTLLVSTGETVNKSMEPLWLRGVPWGVNEPGSVESEYTATVLSLDAVHKRAQPSSLDHATWLTCPRWSCSLAMCLPPLGIAAARQCSGLKHNTNRSEK